MATVFSVKLCHEGFVGVSDHDDARVEGFDLLPATLVCLNADGPAAPPVVPLPFKPCTTTTTTTQ